MAGLARPEMGKQALVGEHHLPGRLEEPRRRGRHRRTERVLERPFPGVELEQGVEGLLVRPAEGAVRPQADLGEVEQDRRAAGLDRAILKVAGGAEVFRTARIGGEGDEAGRRDLGETRNQPFVKCVELVAARRKAPFLQPLFEPEPLEHGGFVEGGRGVGVVFEELGWPRAAVGEIEASVEARIAPVPTRSHRVPDRFGNRERGEDALVRDRLRREIEAERVQLGARSFDVVFDLGQREGVGVALVPIGFAVDGVEGKAGVPRNLPPAGPLSAGEAAHQVPPKEEKLLPLLPKPPNCVAFAAAGLSVAEEAWPPPPVETLPPDPVQ